MPRVKRGTKRRAKRKKILERASGYFLTKSKLYRSAKEAVERGLKFAYSGRKQKKRQYRSIWIVRIGAAATSEWTELQPVHQRTEEGRRGTGSQDPGGLGGERSGGIWQSGGAGEEGERGSVRAAVSTSAVSFKSYFGWLPVLGEAVVHASRRRTCEGKSFASLRHDKYLAVSLQISTYTVPKLTDFSAPRWIAAVWKLFCCA